MKQDKTLLKNHKANTAKPAAKPEEKKKHEEEKEQLGRSLAEQNKAVVLQGQNADSESTPTDFGRKPGALKSSAGDVSEQFEAKSSRSATE